MAEDTSEKNWREEVIEENLVTDEKGQKFIPLKELWRIARIRGIQAKTVDVKVATPLFACVEVCVEFKDTECVSGVADAGVHNIPQEDFAIYPSAMAENRALARALRFGLNILDICSQEEVGGIVQNSRGKQSDEITTNQINCINSLVSVKKLDIDTILGMGKRKVNKIEELTRSEAKSLIVALNNGKIEAALGGK